MKKLTILAPAAALFAVVLTSCTTPETTTTTTSSTTRQSATMSGATPDPMGSGTRANAATMPRGGGM